MPESIRADKWLWATRFFKTRALAAEILGLEKVTRKGHPLKRASSIQIGDVINIPFIEGPGHRTIHVKAIIAQRPSAPEAQACYEDKTLPDVFETLRKWQIAKQESAKGRPTKKDRRAMDRIRDASDWDA